MTKPVFKKTKEERLEEICEALRNAEKPLCINELIQKTGLQRGTLIPYLNDLQKLQKVCKLEETSIERFQRHREEGLHSYRGRKQKLYKSLEE